MRALNDNLAPIIYNQYHDLQEFFSIGLYVCIFSFVCALILTAIHDKAVKNSNDKMSKQKKSAVKSKAKDDKGLDLPREAYILAIVVSVGYAAI